MVGCVGGQTARGGKRGGRGGGSSRGGEGTASAKIAALSEAGITVSESPATIGEEMAKLLL